VEIIAVHDLIPATDHNNVRSPCFDSPTTLGPGFMQQGTSYTGVKIRCERRIEHIREADHTPHDILLVSPDGKTAKPWLTTVSDDHSRAVAGYFLSFEDPSALHTSLALRQAIWRKEDPRWIVCGIPDVRGVALLWCHVKLR
jgi:transposase InsO family protein